MNRTNFLEGKVAIVTGASRNIGTAVAKRMAEHGAKVGVNYASSQDRAEQIVAEIREAGGEAIAVKADVRDRAEVEAMVKTITDAWGRLDIMVNNARPAPTTWKHYLEMDLDDLTSRVSAELIAMELCTRAALPFMQAQRSGRIINISSTAGRVPDTTGIPYKIAKAAMEALSKSTALALGPMGITVNLVAPGWVWTERTAVINSPERIAEIEKSTPLGHIAQAEEIAGAVAILASDDAAYLTGQYLSASGGLVMP